ncbi:MAG: transcription antitermination factor NusB [Nevskiales bacterium]
MTEAALQTRPRKPSASKRHQARRFAVQALYSHLLAGTALNDLLVNSRVEESFARCDQNYFDQLVCGVLGDRMQLEQSFTEYLDRPLAQLDPVEHAVLLLAAYELAHCPELPYRVAINEAVELTKLFGATEGHKYINGVVDRMARKQRPAEIGGRV